MQIKDLPAQTNLGNLRVKTHNGQIGYWKSQWGYPEGKAGVWLGKNNNGGPIIPVFLDRLGDALEWEITEEEVNI